MKEEMIEIVNEAGQVLGIAPRSRVHGNPALMHRVVHVLVLDKDGRILLQKRSMSKDVAPGRWDTSVGGHVDPGEQLEEAAAREMREELGVDLKTCLIYKYIHTTPYETELVHTYKALWEDEKLRYDPDEIDELRFWSVEEIKAAMGTGVLSDNFQDEFRKYLSHSAHA